MGAQSLAGNYDVTVSCDHMIVISKFPWCYFSACTPECLSLVPTTTPSHALESLPSATPSWPQQARPAQSFHPQLSLASLIIWRSCLFLLNDLYSLGVMTEAWTTRLLLLSDAVMWCCSLQQHCLATEIAVPIAFITGELPVIIVRMRNVCSKRIWKW